MINSLYNLISNFKIEGASVRHVYHGRRDQDHVLFLLETGKDISDYQNTLTTNRSLGVTGDITISWISIDKDTYVFAGIYKNLNCGEFEESGDSKRKVYKSERIKNDFDTLISKLTIKVSKSVGLSYIRNKPIQIIDEYIQHTICKYPGHQNIKLSYDQFKMVLNLPEYRAVWSRLVGVYKWTDKTNGKVYIGSAMGKEGFLQRFNQYADWSHGNRDLSKVNPLNLELSIISTHSIENYDSDHIYKREYLEIEKHMSHLYGYNFDYNQKIKEIKKAS